MKEKKKREEKLFVGATPELRLRHALSWKKVPVKIILKIPKKTINKYRKELHAPLQYGVSLLSRCISCTCKLFF